MGDLRRMYYRAQLAGPQLSWVTREIWSRISARSDRRYPTKMWFWYSRIRNYWLNVGPLQQRDVVCAIQESGFFNWMLALCSIHFFFVGFSFYASCPSCSPWCNLTHHLCLHRPQKMSFRRFFARINDVKHLYLCIFLVRHSVALPQLQLHFLIPKWTTRRWTLRCSNYSVAKRQQFSCALSTATLSWSGSRGLDLIFPVLYLCIFFTAVRARTSTSHVSFFFQVRAAKKLACVTIYVT